MWDYESYATLSTSKIFIFPWTQTIGRSGGVAGAGWERSMEEKADICNTFKNTDLIFLNFIYLIVYQT